MIDEVSSFDMPNGAKHGHSAVSTNANAGAPPFDRRRWPLPGLLAVVALISACRASPAPIARLGSENGTIDLSHGEYRTIGLRFETLGELPEFSDDPQVFVHLLAPDGAIARTFDHSLPTEWWPKSRLDDKFLLLLSALAPPLEPGDYRLVAGLYDPERGKYAVISELPRAGKQSYEIGRVRIRTRAAAAPTIELDGGWQPPGADRDRQVMGARDLRRSKGGSVHLRGVFEGGELLLRLTLPEYGIHGPEVDLADGDLEPIVHAADGCTGRTHELRGSGAVDLKIEIPGSATGADCSIELRSNFVVHPGDGSPPSSLRLQAIGWNPAGSGSDVGTRELVP